MDVDAGGTAITWRRGGVSPEVWYVTFEQSTDGIVYTPLGVGTRVLGGWQLGGLGLARYKNIYLRARAWHGTGDHGGSSTLVQTVRHVYLRPPCYLPLVLR